MLDFSKVTKKFLSVSLTDGSKLLIRMPNKKTFDIILKMQDAMQIINDAETDTETAKAELDSLYELTASVMSNNIGGKEITVEYLSSLLDVEDIQIFYKSYLDFVMGKVNDPN